MIARPALCIFLFSVVLPLSTSGCSITETTSGGGGTTTSGGGSTGLVPKLAISAPAEGACISITEDEKDATVPLTLQTDNLILRPSGFCNSITQTPCGYVVVLVDGVENNRGAASVVDVLLHKVAEAKRYGDWTISVKAMDYQGKPFKGPSGAEIVATVQVRTTKGACESGTTSSGSSGGAGGMGTGGMGTGGMGTGGMGTGGSSSSSSGSSGGGSSSSGSSGGTG